ncbi:hypothetical protein Taro_036615 [Colocasia esculenta]|uniref:Two-component response regulator-like APRR2 n=2 Tax=Magnoliopsida TaxID=3398 RepID=A0A843W7A4_COLES|nr:hypothetical protein [Colocasia esculenta]
MCESPAIDVCLREDAELNMVCHADDLVSWRDFPKGLRVLLFVEDSYSAADIKSKLEQMDYIVSLFRDEKEALKAVSSNAEAFHVAIVEVTTGNSLGCFRFLETARELPTISEFFIFPIMRPWIWDLFPPPLLLTLLSLAVVSEAQCISTMMKCIALGAAEFLQKPLSEDKLKNIWQHVVHKAFNAGSAVLSKSLRPIKETVASILQLQPDSGATELKDYQDYSSMVDAAEVDGQRHDEHVDSLPIDKFPAPSTPQLEQSSRSLDDRDCQDQLNCSIDESKDHVNDLIEEQTRLCASESKSVDNTCNNSTGEICKEEPSTPADFVMEDEIDSAYGSKTDERAPPGDHLVPSPRLNHEDGAIKQSTVEDLNQKKASPHHSSSYLGGSRSNKKRIKVDWTPDLHKRFVQAVEQLGIDQAIPSKILELMKAEGLTRHNVASHLQKYRMRKRHILPKDEDRRWQQHGNQVPRAYPYKQFVALPPAHSSCGVPPGHVYHVWGHPNYHHPGVQMWGNTVYSPWQPSGEYWPWKTYPRMHADAWGCPVAPSQNLYPAVPHYPPQNRSFDVPERRNGASEDAYDFRPMFPASGWRSSPWIYLFLQTSSILLSKHLTGSDDTKSIYSDELYLKRENTGAKPLGNLSMGSESTCTERANKEEEVIDEVVREALSKPWLPLPLGLKPPSTESVLTELHRLGVHRVPPR